MEICSDFQLLCHLSVAASERAFSSLFLAFVRAHAELGCISNMRLYVFVACAPQRVILCVQADMTVTHTPPCVRLILYFQASVSTEEDMMFYVEQILTCGQISHCPLQKNFTVATLF